MEEIKYPRAKLYQSERRSSIHFVDDEMDTQSGFCEEKP
jgi:hypothetical protein